MDEVTDTDKHDRVPRPDPTRLTTEQLNREVGGLKEIIFTRLEGMDRAIVLFTKTIDGVRLEAKSHILNLQALLESRLGAMDKAVVLMQSIADRTPGAIDEKTSALREIQDEKFTSIQVQFKERDVRTDQTLKDSKIAIDAALQAVKEAVEQKFASIQVQFKERDVHTDQTSKDSKIAVDAALQAAKEAVDEKFTSIQVQFKERDVRTDQTSKDSKTAVDAALQAAKEAVGEQNKSSAMAISKSEASVVKQIDQMGLLITTQAKAVDDKFSDIKDRLTRIEGKGEGKVVADTTHQASSSQIFTIISVIIAFVSVCAGIFIAVHRG